MKNKKKSLRRTAPALTYTVIILLFLVIIANLVMVYKAYRQPGELPHIFGYKPVICKTDSMSPLINSGDLVIVKEVRSDSLKQNDIVAFRVNDSLLVQRITEIDLSVDKQELKSAPDNPGYEAFNIAGSSVEGRFVLRVHELGNVLIFIQTPMGTIIFIVLPLLLIFALYSVSNRKKADSKTGSEKKPDETAAK